MTTSSHSITQRSQMVLNRMGYRNRVPVSLARACGLRSKSRGLLDRLSAQNLLMSTQLTQRSQKVRYQP